MYKLKKCCYCNKETKNPKFCSSRCSALYHNKPKEYKCKYCNKLLSIGWTYKTCCQSCNPNIKDWSKTTFAELRDKLNTHQAHARIRELSRNIFKKSDKSLICQMCQYYHHVEICHIKPISEFPIDTPISIINDLSNLISLCSNCHWELDHGLLNISDIGYKTNIDQL